MLPIERKLWSGLGWAFLAFLFFPTVLGLQTYTEDFQDDTPPNAPTDNWYDYTFTGTGEGRVSSAQTSISTRTLLIDDTDAAVITVTTFDAGTVGVDFCQSTATPMVFQAAYYFTSFGGGIETHMTVTSTTGIEGFGFKVLSTGAIGTLAGTTSAATFATLSLNTWYNISSTGSLTTSPCDTTGSFTATTYIQELDVGGQATGVIGGAAGTLVFDNLRIQTSTTGTPRLFMDNLQFVNVNDPPATAIGALASVAVTDLVGFDVDQTGFAVIARTDSGESVQTWNPIGSGALTELGTPGGRDTDCGAKNDMVATSDVAIVYITCDSGTTNPAFLTIRDKSGDVFDFPDDCSPSDDCLDDIELRTGDCNSFSDDQTIRQISDMSVVPLDYSYVTLNEFGLDAWRAIAVAYAATNGNIGLLQYTTRTGDDACIQAVRGFAGSTPEQICVWQPVTTRNSDGSFTDDRIRIAAVDTGSNTRVYTYDPAVSSTFALDGTLDSGVQHSIAGARGVGCAGQNILLVTNDATDNVHLVNSITGVEQAGFPKTAASPADRGAFLSGDGAHYAYVAGGTVQIGNTTGTTTPCGQITFSGTFKEFRATTGMQQAWLAQSNLISYHNVQTSAPNCAITGATGVATTDTPPTSTAGLFGGAGAAIGSPLGIGEFGGNLLAGSLLIVFVAAGLYAFTRSIVIAGLGVGVGFLIGWGFGFFSAGVVFAVVVIVGGGAFLLRGRGAAG